MNEGAGVEIEGAEAAAREARVDFTGTRGELLGILVRGYLTMPFTLGLYRFWMLTQKRRFYSSHTEIDGDALEYTGTPVQLLVGFMIAVLIFLPLYLFFFWLSLQRPEAALFGYGGVALLMYFLAGYAIYRSRRFRLTRTFWRGIRFHQTGSAWWYAVQRMLWSVLVIITLGLAYPFMVVGLARYRYRHTWFGDRQFSIDLRAWPLVWRFLLAYLLPAALVVAAVVVAVAEDIVATVGLSLLAGTSATFGYFYYRAREVTLVLSGVRAGSSRLTVKVRARDLLAQAAMYAVSLGGAMLAFAAIFGVLVASMAGQYVNADMFSEAPNFADIAAIGVVNLVILGVTYLALLGTFAALAELILGFGYWMLVARDAVISDADSLLTVRAHGEESPLAGEGLADALNVGGY